ncbi:hypothetical protein FRC11_006736, partial [Ceratobasidium sp. 423]
MSSIFLNEALRQQLVKLPTFPPRMTSPPNQGPKKRPREAEELDGTNCNPPRVPPSPTGIGSSRKKPRISKDEDLGITPGQYNESPISASERRVAVITSEM